MSLCKLLFPHILSPQLSEDISPCQSLFLGETALKNSRFSQPLRLYLNYCPSMSLHWYYRERSQSLTWHTGCKLYNLHLALHTDHIALHSLTMLIFLHSFEHNIFSLFTQTKHLCILQACLDSSSLPFPPLAIG